MKKIFFCLSLGVMCASLALAQDTATAPSATPVDSNASAGSIQGCLSGSDGNYTLTQDGTNTTFNVSGSDSMLKKHVGHEVALTGQMTSGAGSAGSAGASAGSAGASAGSTGASSSTPGSAGAPSTEPSQAQPSAGTGAAGNTIQVSDVRMVSRTCGTGPDATSPKQ